MTALLDRLRRRQPVPAPAPVTADAAARHLLLASMLGRLPEPLPVNLALLVKRIDAGLPWPADATALIGDAYAIVGRIGARAQTDGEIWRVWGWLHVLATLEQQLGLAPEAAR